MCRPGETPLVEQPQARLHGRSRLACPGSTPRCCTWGWVSRRSGAPLGAEEPARQRAQVGWGAQVAWQRDAGEWHFATPRGRGTARGGASDDHELGRASGTYGHGMPCPYGGAMTTIVREGRSSGGTMRPRLRETGLASRDTRWRAADPKQVGRATRAASCCGSCHPPTPPGGGITHARCAGRKLICGGAASCCTLWYGCQCYWFAISNFQFQPNLIQNATCEHETLP